MIVAGYISTAVLTAGYITSRAIFGSCPIIESKQNFDINQYLGTWYEMRRSPNPFRNNGCTTANYRILPDGYVEVLNTSNYIEDGTSNKGRA